MTVIWKPTNEECEVIRTAAGREANAPARALVLQPGYRFNTRHSGIAESLNIALVSDEPEWGDTDLADYGRWSDFRKGIELTADGRATLDLYIYKKGAYDDLLGNVTLYYQEGRIIRIHGYPGEYPTNFEHVGAVCQKKK